MKYRKHLLTIISLTTCLALTGCDMPGFIYDTGYWLDDKVDDLGNWLNGNELEEFTYKDTEPYVPPVIDIEPEVSEEVIRIEDEAPEEEGIYIAELDLDQLRNHRRDDVMGDKYRRPDVYGILG